MRRFNDAFLDGDGAPVRKRGVAVMDAANRALAEATEQLLKMQEGLVKSVTAALANTWVTCSAQCGYTCKALEIPSDRHCVECGAKMKMVDAAPFDEHHPDDEDDDKRRTRGVGKLDGKRIDARKDLGPGRLDGARMTPIRRSVGRLDGAPLFKRGPKKPRIL
jgi:hypothetical protein